MCTLYVYHIRYIDLDPLCVRCTYTVYGILSTVVFCCSTLGKLYFVAFSVIVFFILVNMFIGILTTSYDQVRTYTDVA